MQPVEFPGSTEIKKPANMTDEECMSAWALIHRDEKDRVAGFTTKWMPSYEDIQALNRGEGIFIHCLGSRLTPMSLFTLDENGLCNDAG